MADIRSNWNQVLERVAAAARRSGRSPDEVTVVAVSKTQGEAAIRQAIGAGATHLGENRIQEAVAKIEALAAQGYRPTWHLIGHLQTNKVRTAVRIFDIIESVDSLRLAEAIALAAERPVSVLLQVNVAGEATKGGFRLDGSGPAEAEELMPALARIQELPHLRLMGLMTIAPRVDDVEEVRPVFRQLRELRDRLGLEHLSMGMTEDYEVAIAEGATIVRVGRAIFGERRPGGPAAPSELEVGGQ